MAVTWDPTQYHRYGDLRLRPAIELFNRVASKQPEIFHDIGTGGGEIARLATKRWPATHVIGSDSSMEMLETARAAESTVDWRWLDINDWHPEPEHAVIYANAVLHWLPNHAELFPRLMGGLVPGGELAVQMPMSWWQPSHRAIRASLREIDTPEAHAIADTMSKPNVNRPSFYWEVLHPHSSHLDIWETTYQQVLSGADPVFEWVSGSILRPIFTQLPQHQLDAFSALCRERLREEYTVMTDGTTLFPFQRLFIIARK